MEKGMSMIEHINNVKTLSEHLEAVDDAVAEKDLVIILISSLPEQYNYLITALETVGEDKLTWDYVRDRLIHEYEKMQGGNASAVGSDPSHDALLMKRDNEVKKKFNQKRVKCFYCKKMGHYAKDCFKKKKDRNSSDQESANISEIEKDAGGNSAFALAASTENSEEFDWCIDSGATQHMSPDKSSMKNYVQFRKPIRIKLADNSFMMAYGKGSLKLSVFHDSEKIVINLPEVLYVPKIHKRLLSLSSMTEKGVEVCFKDKSCTAIVDNKPYRIGHKDGKLYKLNMKKPADQTSCYGASTDKNDMSLWHYRLGHLGYDNLKALKDKSLVKGLNLNTRDGFNRNCEGCAMGKQSRSAFPKETEHKSSEVLEIIHSDVCGPMTTNSVGGSKYFITFTDDFSRLSKIYFMRSKNEAFEKFKEYAKLVENFTGKRIKTFRSDNGGEYSSSEFLQYCKDHGIKKEVTIPYTPQQNGIAERLNRTLMEKARAMIYHAKLPLSFWAEAVSTANYLRNRSPTSALENATPYERFYKQKADVSNLRVFGCNAMVHIPDQKRNKLQKKSEKCVFVGYPEDSKGYKFYNADKKMMLRSRDVIFFEDSFEHKQSERIDQMEYFDFYLPANDVSDVEIAENVPDQPDQLDQPDIQPRRSQRTAKPPERLGAPMTGDWWNHVDSPTASIALQNEEPVSIEEALSGPDASKWKNAADSEYESLIKNGTWKLVDLPDDKNVVGCKWIFKKKRNADGSINRYKARLVAQGYSQKEGLDYEETFSPVAKYSSIRTVLAIANEFNLEIHQMDVKTAFLNGKLDCDIYMEQPEGYVDRLKPNMVCKLEKSLYGLKQSARCWNQSIDHYLRQLGYIQSDADACIYYKSVAEDGQKPKIMIIALFVDDLILATNDTDMLAAEKLDLRNKFEMEDQGEIHYCLGMSIKRNREAKILTIDQKSYLETVLKKFQMFDCKPVATPLEAGKKFEKLPDGEESVNKQDYQAAIGSLIYASVATRPDLASAIGILSQFSSNPGKEHWTGVKRVLRYIKGTLEYGLEFNASNEEQCNLYGYSDADWAGDISTRKSTSGYLFRFAGATISWKSKRQSVVALSSTEAEYIALSAAAQETIWLRRLLQNLGKEQQNPTRLYEDNQGAIAISKNSRNSNRTKHIDIKYHFVRESLENNEIKLVYCPTGIMIADILTKSLARPRFEELRTLMGVKSC
eukprot:gene7838-biopygen6374